MAAPDLDRLIPIVVSDAALTARLAAIGDRADFVTAVTAVAAEHGLDVTPADVEAALRAARRAWQERWV